MYSDSVNPFGLLNGRLVSIDDVPQGSACGCLCPKCKEPLVAKKGHVNVHHFSHLRKSNCSGSLETALHIKAKDVFLKYDRVTLPGYPGQSSSVVLSTKLDYYGRPYATKLATPCIKYEYSNVFIEAYLGKIKPDVILSGYEPFIIEIFVTHKTDHSKIQEIKKLGLFAVEIDLSWIRKQKFINDSVIEDAVIFNLSNKRWISYW